MVVTCISWLEDVVNYDHSTLSSPEKALIVTLKRRALKSAVLQWSHYIMQTGVKILHLSKGLSLYEISNCAIVFVGDAFEILQAPRLL